ncbi:MAG: PASTA domain-containing protein [Saprospiraceae bacterium]|nr:PASTA domain-containing protein [Saprospiraceae bacterium]HMX89250.1 penicillin-binding transpeptidase domain-containing protein [Saprospiraceae bacterium]HMZ41167.1 penicillin-binding transpeptidase domain-containing protein [Saprospiraceae bacterium]HNA65061.1 penicillin-binding transpeptidase domain-containing protein [Saprospiraceae bacterium]HNE63710.1 penicillin-binding transpeptidase domain-containing protein [Saprospiraceae bacterium]
MSRKGEFLSRVYFITIVFVLVAVALVVQAVRISVIEGDHWKSRGKELYYQLIDFEAERGKILADDGSPLAISLPFFDIHMDAAAPGLKSDIFNQQVDSLALCLSKFVYENSSKEEVRRMLVRERQRGNHYVLIRKSVDYSLLQSIKKFPIFRLGQNKGGLIIDRVDHRERPYKLLAGRTIGIQRENAQSVGLESKYHQLLRGQSGQRLMKKVGPNVYLPMDEVNEIEARKGKDIMTTLNMEIQEVAEKSLQEAIETHHAEKGCAIVMEVRTGAIKAIANLGYDNNGLLAENFNYAVGNSTEPGSTLKLASVAAMMEEQRVDLHTPIDLNGGVYYFYNRKMPDSELHGVGMSDLEYAFIKSSNVGISRLAFNSFGTPEGQKKFASYYKKFGLTEPTQIDLEGEPLPVVKHPVKDKDKWYGTTVPWMSVGYELQLTPLQVLTFYNGIANNGRVMKPYLVSSVLDNDVEIRKTAPVVLRDSILSSNTLLQLNTLLRAVVEKGTASSIRSEQYSISGKTGTAVTNYHLAGAEKKEFQASFCGFFPSEDPQYSCIVVIYNPEVGFYGGQAAAPVFRKIADRCMRPKLLASQVLNAVPKPVLASEGLPVGNYGYQRDFEQVFKHIELPYFRQDQESWVRTIADKDGVHTLPQTVVKGLIPDLTGMGLRDALFLLDQVKIRVKIHGSGKVKWQSIPPGAWTSDQREVIELILE